jgi:hypothetical protein
MYTNSLLKVPFLILVFKSLLPSDELVDVDPSLWTTSPFVSDIIASVQQSRKKVRMSVVRHARGALEYPLSYTRAGLHHKNGNSWRAAKEMYWGTDSRRAFAQ